MTLTALILPLAAGALLGAANYAALWYSVNRLVRTRKPGAVALLSFVVRMAFVAAGFFAVSGGEPAKLVACVLGFLLARTLAVRLASPSAAAEGGD